MLECSSLVSCCILSGIMLLIADLRHSCFACHLQTVHPFQVILISISTKITSSFQRHTWFAMLIPWSFFPFRSTHMHCISYLAYHAMYCIMLLVHCTVIDCRSIACVLALGRAGRWVRDEEPVEYTCEDQAFDDSENFASKITIPLKSLLSLLASCSLYCYVALPTTCYIMPPILPCQASNPPFLANHCLAMLPLLLSLSYSVASCRWRWSLFHVGTWICWDITISLI